MPGHETQDHLSISTIQVDLTLQGNGSQVEPFGSMLPDKAGSHRFDCYKRHGLSQWDSNLLPFDPYRAAYCILEYLEAGVLQIHSQDTDKQVDTQNHKVYKFVHKTLHKMVHTLLTHEGARSLATLRFDQMWDKHG